MPGPVTCARCGTAAPSSPPPLDWSGGVEPDGRPGHPGRRVWLCPTCVRVDLRSIEGKLSQRWW